eukprot:204304-Hanusia_phi.AAC.1
MSAGYSAATASSTETRAIVASGCSEEGAPSNRARVDGTGTFTLFHYATFGRVIPTKATFRWERPIELVSLCIVWR